MAVRTPISETSLRRAMRHDLCWHPWNPERRRTVAWVTEGYRALAAAEGGGASGGTVSSMPIRGWSTARRSTSRRTSARPRRGTVTHPR